MKQFAYILITAFLTIAAIPFTVAGQVRISEKPVPPRTMMKTPPKPGPEYVLLPGRWAWHRQSQMYIWLGPAWVVPPKNRTWSPGYWKSEKEGWRWVPGKWQRKRGILHRRSKTMNP